ncbi:Ig-like domain-containing protein [Serinibacter arcticus]|uniref:Glycerol-3-phosphate ABC transporter, periplasmic glycerol-3-phosphate-binding protein n=1 Tax=Serinibacter arcticus TaxID=1655435 RepID=A0A4Z1E1C7_9MICO|nr:Ig-like domain-containing protein [Serinibacter arcticus]TGO05755.1 Glycerol-3-phosphate ABC transporter, periplasmic glycerol-3-phosphate-binding protein [Serinibacter arcticus]
MSARRTLALTAALTVGLGAAAVVPTVAAPDGGRGAAPAVAVEAARDAEEAANVAPLAQPTASFTSPWHVIDTVNDGEIQPTGPFDAAWATWDGSRPASQWLEYTWEVPVTLERSEMSFWSDGTEANGDNVRVPSSWTIQAWDEAAGAWADLTGASGFGLERTTPNVTTFEPVTTTKVRATLQALPGTATPVTYSAVGVTEWALWGTGGAVVVEPEDPDAPLEVEAVHVPTAVGVLPQLPDVVGVTWVDGGLEDRAVAWESVALADVEAAGSFTVTGDVEGVATDAEATVWVRDGEPGALTSLDPVSVVTLVGVAPALPSRVTAEYADGSRDSRIGVTWETPDAADYAAEGELVLEGDAEGTDLVAEALVWVLAADDGEDTIAPTVTLTTAPNPGPAGWYQEDVTVTLVVTDNRDDDLAGEIRVGDGAYAAYDGPVTIDADGVTTVSARAADAAGNTRETTRELRVDATAPVTTASVVTLGASVEVTLTAQDATSGVDRIQWEGPGTFWGTYQEPFTRALTEEVQVIEFAATDAAGNAEDRVRLELPALAEPEVPGFVDVPEGSLFFEEIAWLATAGISTGWELPDGSREFRPVTPIARDAMAAFLYREAGSPAFEAPKVSPFSDVDVSNQFYEEIAWLAEEGISTGWVQADGTAQFRPYEPIARDAMAAFLHRAAGSPAVALPAASPFDDVTPATQFYAEITWMHAGGISTGWEGNDGSRIYQPLSPVNRDAMAAFLYRFHHHDLG